MSIKEPFPIRIPLINPNENEAILAGIHVREGQQVKVGDLLCTLETTKSTAEVQAETDGYVVGLDAEQGKTVSAGDILCYLSGDPHWKPPKLEASTAENLSAPETSQAPVSEAPPSLRITQPALELARQHSLNLDQLPTDQLVTVDHVRILLEKVRLESADRSPESAYDPTAILIYGGGGHGKALIDLLRSLGTYRIVGIVDDSRSTSEKIMGLPVLGGSEALARLYEEGVRQAVNAVGGIGDLSVRVRIFQRLAQAGFVCPALVHPSAVIEPSATLSPGVQVMPHAYVGSEAHLGFGVIVNSGAIVSHDCQLGEYTNIAPGAVLAGEVQVGAQTLVGMGVTINLRVQIGAEARIGNSATVIKDVPQKGIVRAGSTWPQA
jgi:sugar O-acyltransferase (sialic acid O-acetyltransferase NeuD family)